MYSQSKLSHPRLKLIDHQQVEQASVDQKHRLNFERTRPRRISLVRSHSVERLDWTWFESKTEFDFHWSTRTRKTVTAAPRKIDFWLGIELIGLHSLARYTQLVAWALDYSIETKIYTLQRFDLRFFFRWWDKRLYIISLSIVLSIEFFQILSFKFLEKFSLPLSPLYPIYPQSL